MTIESTGKAKRDVWGFEAVRVESGIRLSFGVQYDFV